jgi:hypothetical protein
VSSSPQPEPAWRPDAAEPARGAVAVPPADHVRPVAAPSRTTASGPSLGRSVAIVALFIVGIVAGIGGFVALNPAPPPVRYPELAGAPEPPVAHALAAALKANDADGVASHVLSTVASSLSDALKPIVDVTDVTYVGTVEHDGRDLAGYIVAGRDQQSQKQIVGFVVDVVNDEIIGINE